MWPIFSYFMNNVTTDMPQFRRSQLQFTQCHNRESTIYAITTAIISESTSNLKSTQNSRNDISANHVINNMKSIWAGSLRSRVQYCVAGRLSGVSEENIVLLFPGQE